MFIMTYNQRHSSSLLLISILYLHCYTGGNCLQVKTCAGGDAVLPCEVGPTIDVTDMAVEWSRPGLPRDQYVHFQRNGLELVDTKNPSYEGRTSLIMDEVKKGNVSLKLSRVTSSDEGNYTCLIPECQKEFTVQLIVGYPDCDYPEGKLDSHRGSPEDFSTQFPWWGGLIITLSSIIIILSVLVYKRPSILEFSRSRFCTSEGPAGDEDGKMFHV